jgi:hypothetical protein
MGAKISANVPKEYASARGPSRALASEIFWSSLWTAT